MTEKTEETVIIIIIIIMKKKLFVNKVFYVLTYNKDVGKSLFIDKIEGHRYLNLL